jgi:MOSC domain-containing protein YiiM
VIVNPFNGIIIIGSEKMNSIQIKNLAAGKPKEYEWSKKKEISAIGKNSTSKLHLIKSGFVGDDVANHEFHGGVDRAVCLYPYEHYANWEKEFKKKLEVPAFGENITAAGMLEKDVCIGDVFQIGESIIQVTQGRIPCATISKYNGVNQLLNQVFTTGFAGYFFRVLEEGSITMESDIRLLEKHPLGVTVLFANRVMFHDQKNRPYIEKILEVKELAGVWQEKLKKMLKNC